MSATATNVPISDLTRLGPPAGPGDGEAAGEAYETVIQPRKGWIAVDWGELIRQRELLYFLVWRDVKVRYKQAVLGVAWAVLQPLINVIVFSTIFGSGLNLASQLGSLGKAYPVFVFAGLLPWSVFARAMSEGGMSLVSQRHILTKTYFPRLFVPTASVGGALFDMAVSLPILVVLMVIYRVVPPWTIVFLPLLVLATALLGVGMAFLLSALTVTYRDFRFLIPFIVQIWMWLSWVMIPIPTSFLGKPLYRTVFALNPMYGIINGYRKVLLGMDRGWNPWDLVYSLVAAAVLFTVGVFYFRRTERKFADIA